MIAEQGRVPNRYTETMVYLNKNDRCSDFSGYLEHPAEGAVWRFDDMVTLIVLHEKIFGIANFPQPGYELRGMETKERAKEPMKEIWDMTVNKDDLPLEEKPTFIINVQYRQNASWQGTVKWVEGDIEKRFRSTLELIKLMDSVISGADSPWDN